MELTFEDALRIARGCTDYGGGHSSNAEKYEIYQHGIQTVINALTAARNNGIEDTQVAALHMMGANAKLTGGAPVKESGTHCKAPEHCKRLPIETRGDWLVHCEFCKYDSMGHGNKDKFVPN